MVMRFRSGMKLRSPVARMYSASRMLTGPYHHECKRASLGVRILRGPLDLLADQRQVLAACRWKAGPGH